MEDPKNGKHLIAGTNCYFDYDKYDEFRRQEQAEKLSHPSIVQMAGVLDIKAPVKKKKKKSKGKAKTPAAESEPSNSYALTNSAKSGFSVEGATLADPDAAYPESRVIRAGPYGEVVVESLDDVYPRDSTGTVYTNTMVPPVMQIPSPLARKVLQLDSNQYKFWNELSPQTQRQLFTINGAEVEAAVSGSSADSADPSWAGTSRCYCSKCERNDVHVLGLVAEGFRTYMLDLINRLWEHFELQYHDIAPPDHHGKCLDMTTADAVLENGYDDTQNARHFDDIAQIEQAGRAAGESPMTVRNFELYHYVENIVIPVLKREFALNLAIGAQRFHPYSPEERMIQDEILSCAQSILRLILKRNDRTRMLRETKGMGVKPLSPEEFKKMTVGQDLLDCLHTFLKEGMSGIAKSVKFVKVLASVGQPGGDEVSDVTEQMARFADSFTSNDGSAFVDEVSKLKNSAAESCTNEPEADAGDPELEHYGIRNPFSHCKCDFHTQLSRQFESARSKALHDQPESHQHFEEDYDDEFECEHGHHYHHDEDDEDDEEYDDDDEDEEDPEYSDEEPESDEEEMGKKQFRELQGFFFMEARKIIMARFEGLYNKRLSEDRTKQFIEELEAEENAKKEKELKKVRQREKQKEKKRLLQLEKEELRKQQEEEELEKAAALKRKQEQLRAEQIRRDEEARLKKEQEKLKKIEALKLKEQAQLAEAEAEAKAKAKAKAKAEAKAEAKALESKLKAEAKAAKIAAQAKEKSDLHPTPEKKKKGSAKENAKQAKASQTKASATKKAEVGSAKNNANATPNPAAPAPTPTQAVNKEETPKEPAPPAVLPKVVSDVVQDDAAASFLPPKNHLLEQLYPSRPRTVSATAGDPLDLFNEQGPASRMGTSYSPSKKSLSSYQPDSWNAGAGAPFVTDKLNAQGLDRPQFLNGNASTWGSLSSQDGLSNPAGSASLMPNLPSSTIWSSNYPSRGSSIWGTNSVPANEQHVPNLWAAPSSQDEPLSNGGSSKNNKELIQSAAFKAIKETEAVKDAADGMSSAMRIFQTAKTVLNDNSLKMSDFLSVLHSSTKYHFEIIYDDFGSVTDIKANIQPERIFGTPSMSNKSPSPHQVHAPPIFHPQSFSQMEPSLNFQNFGPSQMPMAQPAGQPMSQAINPPSFQTAVNQDPFQAPNGSFHPSVQPGAQFSQTTVPSNQSAQAVDNTPFQPGIFRGSSEKVNQFESKISETMQGSLSQLGIGQVRSGIW